MSKVLARNLQREGMVTMKKVTACASCAETLKGAGYAVREKESSDKRSRCQFCQRIGWFSIYETEKPKKEEAET